MILYFGSARVGVGTLLCLAQTPILAVFGSLLEARARVPSVRVVGLRPAAV